MEEVGLKVKNIRYFKSQPWAFTDTEMIGFLQNWMGTIRSGCRRTSFEAGWYTREEIPGRCTPPSVSGTEMKMYFKYGPDWEKVAGTPEMMC